MAFIQFVLVDKKEDQSSFYLNEDGTRDTERKLDFTNSRGILNPYFLINENGVREYKQYIVGCATYDPAEQEKQKIKATLQNSLVEFVKGAPIVLDEIKGKVLIDWLRAHPFNVTGPNHKPDEHEAMFKEYDPKAEALKEVQRVDIEDKAMDILRGLKANPERMKSVAVLFDDTANLSDESEIYLGLRKIAKETPDKLINSIANKENKVLSEVKKALNLGVIEKDAKGYLFQGDGALIMDCTIKREKDANSMLVTFLMSAEGDIFYKQILVKVQQKEIELQSEEK